MEVNYHLKIIFLDVGGDPNDGPIPVPQSDFEIEINSTGQEGNGGSPTQESGITLTSASITIEQRVSYNNNNDDIQLCGSVKECLHSLHVLKLR